MFQFSKEERKGKQKGGKIPKWQHERHMFFFLFYLAKPTAKYTELANQTLTFIPFFCLVATVKMANNKKETEIKSKKIVKNGTQLTQITVLGQILFAQFG